MCVCVCVSMCEMQKVFSANIPKHASGACGPGADLTRPWAKGPANYNIYTHPTVVEPNNCAVCRAFKPKVGGEGVAGTCCSNPPFQDS